MSDLRIFALKTPVAAEMRRRLRAVALVVIALTVFSANRAAARDTLNFDTGWKFIKQDVPGAEKPDFDDSKWETVSTPHTFNDVDTFDELITKKTGEANQYLGLAWYRKHFKLPAERATAKVFLEVEGLRQAGRFYLNGKEVGLHEDGVTAVGLDLTDAAKFGDADNVLAVKIDNTTNYREEATGAEFQWNFTRFYQVFGGLNQHVWLHLTDRLYQTLPLYGNLKTTGVYVYPTEISVTGKTATINIESEVRNERATDQTVQLTASVGDLVFTGAPQVIKAGGNAVLKASGRMTGVRFWSDLDAYMYTVQSSLNVDGKPVDVVKTSTGFRKTAFRGGAGAGGVYLNDRFVYLKGYAQRTTDEWAGLGSAYPDWMHEYTARCVVESKANHIRWMHVVPMRADVTACDKFGIIQIMPAGDHENDAKGRQWEQRKEAMRDAIIYYRNQPSILLYEAGNNGISAAHMKEMRDLRDQFDPHGGRAMGCRSLKEDAVGFADYQGTMLGKPISDLRRDKVPLIEAENIRDEAARRFWDDFSPPHFGFKPDKKAGDEYAWNSETFCLQTAKEYWKFYSNIITNTDPARAQWSGYASIIFTDSNSHGRQPGSEVCRVSGKMDAVRLPKEAYFTHRVMQNDQPDIHIIGHWSYPQDTKKTVYVVCNQPEVELFLNGKSLGKTVTATNHYLYAFPAIAYEPGTLKAVGYAKNRAVCEHQLHTVGAPAAIKLTPITGPGGLRADGADVALLDVEVVDEHGDRCPTDEGRIDFTITGPGIWRGGYNSGKPGSINNLYLDTECGINRVAVRSTLTAGTITVTASRPGLKPASVPIVSQAKP